MPIQFLKSNGMPSSAFIVRGERLKRGATATLLHDLRDGHSRSIQAHRLQPLQFMPIAGSLLRLPQLFDFLLVELKLSFRHALILT